MAHATIFISPLEEISDAARFKGSGEMSSGGSPTHDWLAMGYYMAPVSRARTSPWRLRFVSMG